MSIDTLYMYFCVQLFKASLNHILCLNLLKTMEEFFLLPRYGKSWRSWNWTIGRWSLTRFLKKVNLVDALVSTIRLKHHTEEHYIRDELLHWTGRYSSPKMPLSEKGSSDIGTETHFLLSCPSLVAPREDLTMSVLHIYPDFTSLTKYYGSYN